ncbi:MULTISPECIES: RNA polymerase sigma factor SigJ [unclassified Amycolatopsis]|uniref:RNA polymerase sigma factor SigJ n=1 Tax=unclassified Amycolatopsis TaxID=2618356 RepID=UPI0028747576|nr:MULTISPECIES: RNA polymerase sigma factor SigJ [unclassified Amycolatopsis]MDS0132159.1 RNA polymerase sigma factor SigJ [Amycolatopsis sp. 505]MDS0141103.1 RNA polymerase sigma factor SigJ [Amycolatopsis sp. CM201R]
MTDLLQERRQLTGLAYRLLGSLSDAEDVVQEAYGRWYALPGPQREAIASPGAWLTTVASRLCLDQLRSARVRRERYVGEWLPEPLPGETGAGTDPADRVTLDESVTMAFLVVLEAMTPAERVAFVLHDVFGYPFAEVAAVLGRSPAAARQLASSARRRVRAARAPEPARGSAEVVRAFKTAWEAGDIEGLVGLLDPGATVVADGGGLVSAVRRPIVGGERVARYAVDLTRRIAPLSLGEATVNGRPGLVARRDGALVAVLAFEVAGEAVRRIWAVRNPEKLRYWPAG